MDRKSLLHEVRDNLESKRYVVVFDDVWNENFWADIDFAMINNKNGSKILITTRKMDFANVCKKYSFVQVHELKSLTKEQSLELFNKKAFRDLNGSCPENLIESSSKIIEKCNGLPLAIIVIGGLLSCSDRNALEWYKLCDDLNSMLKGDSTIQIMLGHSYHDLPYNLKSCLLYFGLYPEDCVVTPKTLIQQWIAEGFVKEDRNQTLEEVAYGYLTELIRRSLVQVVSISIDGRAKSCRVHDLVHVMILDKCEDLSFCKTVCEDKQSSSTGMVRRLSIATNSDNLPKSIDSSQVRSLISLIPDNLHESFIKTIPKKYRLLKVLAIYDDKNLLVPQDLGNLIHLKYFSFNVFKGEYYYEFPKSVFMLENLETLDLIETGFSSIPKEICKLRKLRHFLGCHMCLIDLKDGIGGMTSLQTLRNVYLGSDENDDRIIELIQELAKLTDLRVLVLLGVWGKHMSAISASINEMHKLEKLKICTFDDNIVIDIHLNSPLLFCRNLKLSGRLDKLPEWIPKLPNLVKLKLVSSHLTGDIMILLKSMPNSLSLSVSFSAYDGESLHFQDGWFKNLKELYLQDMDNLNHILIDQGALISLKRLELEVIPKLKTFPTGIQHLKKLEALRMSYLSDELVLEGRVRNHLFQGFGESDSNLSKGTFINSGIASFFYSFCTSLNQ